MMISLETILIILSAGLFLLGWACLLTQRVVLKQIVGLKILLQSVTLILVLAGLRHDNLHLAQLLVISALVVEAVIVSLALAMVIGVIKRIPTGDVDQLRSLRG
jgi:NADH-quinone oxidoreductase subunit K